MGSLRGRGRVKFLSRVVFFVRFSQWNTTSLYDSNAGGFGMATCMVELDSVPRV
jgi:hypothetical protein